MNKGYRSTLLTYGSWWLVWFCIQTWALHHVGLDWKEALVDAAITTNTLTLAWVAAQFSLKYYEPGKGNRWYRFILAIALTVLSSIIINYILKEIYADNIGYLTYLEKSWAIRFAFSFLMISFMTLIGMTITAMKEQQENLKRKEEAESLSRDAELASLRQQIQPHFLFNSLNSISALAGSRPEEARKMIQQLSDFLRGTLKKDEKQLVLFSEELQLLQLYLDIEKVRFGHRLIIELNPDENALNMKLPALLLQPIVENAIKFGLYDTTGETTIKMLVKTDNNLLIFQVENPFDAQTAKPKKGTGFGLSSVQRRLNLLYFRNDLLSTQQKENIFITTVKIPQSV